MGLLVEEAATWKLLYHCLPSCWLSLDKTKTTCLHNFVCTIVVTLHWEPHILLTDFISVKLLA